MTSKTCSNFTWRMACHWATYGEAEVECFVQHFRPALERNDFDFADVAGEWSALKACVTANNSGN